MSAKISRCEVFWVDLDPVRGSELAKTRPCVVVSETEVESVPPLAPTTSGLLTKTAVVLPRRRVPPSNVIAPVPNRPLVLPPEPVRRVPPLIVVPPE